MKGRLTITLDFDADGDSGRVEDAVDGLLDAGQLQELIQDAARDMDVDNIDFLSSRCTLEPLPDEAPREPRFYIRSSVTGDCALFWKQGDHGYTMDLRDAALYSREDAERRMRPGVDETVAEADALQALRHHVDFERLPRPICFKCEKPIAAYEHYYIEPQGKRHATAANCKPAAGGEG